MKELLSPMPQNVTFRGRPTIELLPVSDWRERLKSGRPMEWYAEVSGLALIDGVGVHHVETRINGIALNAAGEIPDLVPGLVTKSFGLKPADAGHSVRCFTRVVPGSDGVLEFCKADGSPLGEGESPVFKEPEVIGADGQPIDLAMGHRYLVSVEAGMTIELVSCDLQHKTAKDGTPVWGSKDSKAYFRAFPVSRVAVKALVAEVPSGKGLALGGAKVIRGYNREAARTTGAAVAASAPVQTQAAPEFDMP